MDISDDVAKALGRDLDIDPDEIEQAIADAADKAIRRSMRPHRQTGLMTDDTDDPTDDTATIDELTDAGDDGWQPDGESKSSVGTVMGQTPETARAIDETIGDGYTAQREFERVNEDPMGVTMDPTVDPTTYEALSIDVREDEAEKLIGSIYRQKFEVEQQYAVVETLILGVNQYAVVDTWCRAKHGEPIEHRLPFEEVITVPGPMLHVPIPNEDMLFEYYEADA